MSSLVLSRRLQSQWQWSATIRWPLRHPLKRKYTNAKPPPKIIHNAIIIGGGPTGLLLSNLLSSYNIHSHLLFDKRPVDELLKHPQAHFINVRSMEILKAEVPRVYEGVLRDMPEVGEWDGFHFGGSVLESDGDADDARWFGGGRRMGRVIHPVREHLRVGQSGDAVLVPKTKSDTKDNADTESHEMHPSNDASVVSMCRPAHLAQNKFVALLLREASRRHQNHCDDKEKGNATDTKNNRDNQTISNHLRYGEGVIDISEQNNTDDPQNEPFLTIHTSKGQSYHTRYLLAADGVHSFARQHYRIPMMGDSCMQNLINVHFRTNESLSELLMSRNSNNDQAMLHFVYNSHLVGAFVCHDGNDGEWVLQIPYFPPFQTVESDFDENTVRAMIWAGLVGESRTNANAKTHDDCDFEILSIRPWTMSSLVAQRYCNDAGNVALVGDAAHAFPPAGGFGMNTGLQDAHNIAWRLALLLHGKERNASDDKNDMHHTAMPVESASSSTVGGNNILSKYDQERRPVATQNAALSVRNYQRTLRIAKACYLDAQHPQLLISVLNSPPMSLLPLEARQAMFRRLVRVAMMPLGSLLASPQSSSPSGVGGGRSLHADHIEKNVRSILENGGSLPLVFPRYELGFSYNSNGVLVQEVANIEADDASGYVPKLKVGHRMPHVMVEVLPSLNSKENNIGCTVLDTLTAHSTDNGNSTADASSEGDAHISLTDISSQLRRSSPHPSPVFTLVSVGPALTAFTSLTSEAANCAMNRWNVPIVIINILPDKHHMDDHTASLHNPHFQNASKEFRVVYGVDIQRALPQLLNDERDKSNDAANALIMIRPDGHIANICFVSERECEDKTISKRIQQVIEEGYRNALG